MRDVFIIGAGQTPVGEHWDLGLRELGAAAVRAALADAGLEGAEEKVDALYAGNMLGGRLNGQENVAALLVDAAGLLPAEAWKVEAACASGGAVVRAAALAVASGAHDVAVGRFSRRGGRREAGSRPEQAPQSALTPGPSPISRPHPRRERGDKKRPERGLFFLAFLPSPGEGWRELGEGPGVRAPAGGPDGGTMGS